MAQSTDINSEAFQEVLGEALRSGPGSPAWKQAVDTLREAGAQGDEYALLCRAREDLESGKDYRTIHAGAGFTRKLMDQIEHEQPPRWSLPSANIIAVAAVAAIVIAIVAVSWLIFTPATHTRTIAELQEIFCVTPIVDAQFGPDLPNHFAKLGQLPIAKNQRGLSIDARTAKADQHLGGGVYYTQPLPADGTYAIETTLELANPKTTLIAQLFVTDEAAFSPDKGISPHELVCLVESGRLRVMLPDGQTAGEAPLTLDAGSLATIRLKLSSGLAIIEHGGKTVWAGPYHLAGAGRYVGLRYLARGDQDGGDVAVRALRIMKP